MIIVYSFPDLELIKKNRIRFNIVNIPFQNEINKDILNTNKEEDINKLNNSLLVCETFKSDFEHSIELKYSRKIIYVECKKN